MADSVTLVQSRHPTHGAVRVEKVSRSRPAPSAAPELAVLDAPREVAINARVSPRSPARPGTRNARGSRRGSAMRIAGLLTTSRRKLFDTSAAGFVTSLKARDHSGPRPIAAGGALHSPNDFARERSGHRDNRAGIARRHVALAPQLPPDEMQKSGYAAHRIVSSLFGGGIGRHREYGRAPSAAESQPRKIDNEMTGPAAKAVGDCRLDDRHRGEIDLSRYTKQDDVPHRER